MLYITYPSAARFWASKINNKSTATFDYINYSENISEAKGNTLDLPEPVCVMTARRRNYGKYKYVASHSRLPQKCFVKISNDVAVASPEFCFLEAARHLPFDYLVEYGNCLCASYVLDSESSFGQNWQIPITSSQQIIKFLQDADGCSGVKKARRAAQYICDNSFSPMESRLAVIYFLPRCRGGYGLVRGVLNGEMHLSRKDLEYLNTTACHADIVWEKQKVAVEYDGAASHSSPSQRGYDAKRQTVMNHSDYKIVRITFDQMRGFRVFEETTMILWNDLKVKSRTKELKKYYELRRNVFYRLFKTQHAFF